MKTILTLDDLYSISEYLNDNHFNDAPITITIDVLTKERLQKINQDFFMESNNDNEIVDDVDEIKVNVMGVNFIYKLAKDDTETEEQTIN